MRDVETSAYGVVEKPLTRVGEALQQRRAAQGASCSSLLAARCGRCYARVLNNPLLFPTFSDTVAAFFEGIMSGVLLQRGWFSIKVLLHGLCRRASRSPRC